MRHFTDSSRADEKDSMIISRRSLSDIFQKQTQERPILYFYVFTDYSSTKTEIEIYNSVTGSAYAAYDQIIRNSSNFDSVSEAAKSSAQL